ncbi:MAG: hypothetical protein FWC26_14485 [Fibromonadales bacterium]|nr:hypothetical protein [Fibromonadales bacterium]
MKNFCLATALFVAFLYSCSSDDGGGNSSGNVTKQCTTADNSAMHFCDTRDGRLYKYVEIGNQVWMAENLNYEIEGGKCYGEDGEVVFRYEGDLTYITLSDKEIQANCEKYGRLYDWSTAMALGLSCNENECENQIQRSGHQGICPKGWYIPNYMNWHELITLVGGLDSAGKHLKAKKGWYECGPAGSGSPYLCEDTYGFSALPGGGGFDVYYGDASSGIWWSASEDVNEYAYAQSINNERANAYSNKSYKDVLYSIRCIKGDGSNGSNNGENCTSADNTETKYCSNGTLKTYGSVQDAGGNTYKTIEIGDQVWMAENLNYDMPYTTADVCYDDNPNNCAKHGRLYEWETADIACPYGWHVSNSTDWDKLFLHIGYIKGGQYLKASEGWNDCGPFGSGNSYLCEDTYGFSALPSGYGHINGSFHHIGDRGNWWIGHQMDIEMRYDDKEISVGGGSSLDNLKLSVRCVQN